MFSIITYHGIKGRGQEPDQGVKDPKKIAGVILQIFLIVAAATLFTLAKTGALAGVHSFSWIQLPATEIASLTIFALGGLDALIAILLYCRKKYSNPIPTPQNFNPPTSSTNPIPPPQNFNPPTSSTNPIPPPQNFNPPTSSTNPIPSPQNFNPPISSTNPINNQTGSTVINTSPPSSLISQLNTNPSDSSIIVPQPVNQDSKRVLTDRTTLQAAYKETFTEPLQSLPLKQIQEFACAFSALELKSESLENGNLKVSGTPENLHILGEILGVNLDPGVSEYILTPEDQTYLASQAIYQLLTSEGKREMCAALYSLLVPKMQLDRKYELRYLRTHSNQPITLRLSNTPGGPCFSIFTKSEKKEEINFSISPTGQLFGIEKSMSYKIHDALITLLWHNIPLVIVEFDSQKSAEIPKKALGVIKALLADLEGTIKAAAVVDYTKREENTKEYGMCVPVGGGLPIYFIMNTSNENSSSFTGLTLKTEHYSQNLPTNLPLETNTIGCIFAKLHNPVVASQDCTFTYKVISKPKEPPQLSIVKDSEGRGGHFSHHMTRTLSFQTVPGNEDVVQVSIEKENHGGDSMYGYSNESCATYQVSCNTSGQWEIKSMGKTTHSEDWIERNSYMQNDDGSWVCVGESNVKDDKSPPNVKEIYTDLDYILQCLITTYQLERSSHTLVMNHVGEHRVSNAKTSAACVELYADINQGETQGSRAMLRRREGKLLDGARYALPYRL